MSLRAHSCTGIILLRHHSSPSVSLVHRSVPSSGPRFKRLKMVSAPHCSVGAAKLLKCPRDQRGRHLDSYRLLQTSDNAPQLVRCCERPMYPLHSGSKISRFGLGTRPRAQGRSTMSVKLLWGEEGDTSILDKVCFSSSSLLMPLSALPPRRGSQYKRSLGFC